MAGNTLANGSAINSDDDRRFNKSESTSEVTLDPLATEILIHNLQSRIMELEHDSKTIKLLEKRLENNQNVLLVCNCDLCLAREQVVQAQEKVKSLEKETEKLNKNSSELTNKLRDTDAKCKDYAADNEYYVNERKQLYSKIKSLEDNLCKRGQTAQTIFLNKPNDITFYNPREGLGFKNPEFLKKVTSIQFYDVDYMGLGLAQLMQFTGASEDDAMEKVKRDNLEEMQIPFDYTDLNESYNSKETSLLTDYISTFSEKEFNQQSENLSEKPELKKLYVPNLILQKQISILQQKLKEQRKIIDKEHKPFSKALVPYKDPSKSSVAINSGKCFTCTTHKNLLYSHSVWCCPNDDSAFPTFQQLFSVIPYVSPHSCKLCKPHAYKFSNEQKEKTIIVDTVSVPECSTSQHTQYITPADPDLLVKTDKFLKKQKIKREFLNKKQLSKQEAKKKLFISK